MTEAKWAFEVPGKLEIPYRYFAGTFASQWFRALRDEKKILGCRCPHCRKVFVPPRGNCERCLTKIEEWVELPGTGTVESWTVVRYAEPYQPQKPPLVLAVIKLDGADSSLVHLLGGVLPDRVQVGLRVKAVFAQERKGRITDISHFAPAAEAKKKIKYQKPVIKKAQPKAKPKAKKPALKKIAYKKPQITQARPKARAKPKAAPKPAAKTTAKKKKVGTKAARVIKKRFRKAGNKHKRSQRTR